MTFTDLFLYDIINLKKKYEMIRIRNLINIETNQNIILLWSKFLQHLVPFVQTVVYPDIYDKGIKGMISTDKYPPTYQNIQMMV